MFCSNILCFQAETTTSIINCRGDCNRTPILSCWHHIHHVINWSYTVLKCRFCFSTFYCIYAQNVIDNTDDNLNVISQHRLFARATPSSQRLYSRKAKTVSIFEIKSGRTYRSCKKTTLTRCKSPLNLEKRATVVYRFIINKLSSI